MDRWLNKIILGSSLYALKELPSESIHCCVTSPPYWGLRDYGVDGQLGLEKSPEEYTAKMVELFQEVRRVLCDDGTLWLNLGDCYATVGGKVGNCPGGGEQGEAWFSKGMMTSPNRMPIDGLKPKNLVGIPWRVAFALQADGWYLRSDIIWHKPNCMPESIKDRPTKAHEYIFLLSKSERYFYDCEAIKEQGKEDAGPQVAGWDMGPGSHDTKDWATAGKWSKSDPQSAGRRISENVKRARGRGCYHDNPFGFTRNKRTVWTVPTYPYSEAHFATFPPDLIKPCILAGCPENGIVLDPFMGAGTTGVVCADLGRNYIGIELNPDYIQIAENRIKQATRQERLFI